MVVRRAVVIGPVAALAVVDAVAWVPFPFPSQTCWQTLVSTGSLTAPGERVRKYSNQMLGYVRYSGTREAEGE